MRQFLSTLKDGVPLPPFMMEEINNKSCVDCAWFCFWDGDWCCSRNMEIISMGDEHGAAVTPKSVTNHGPCGDFELDMEEGIAYNRSIWKNINGIEDTNR